MNNSKFSDIKEQAFLANKQLPELGLVLFTFGNVSVANRNAKVFAIKPSGVPYSELTAEKMVVVDFEGKTIEGNLRPSSDTLTHAVLYKEWKEINSIVHTHSTYATAWAQSLRSIPIYGTTHADHAILPIPCTQPMDDAKIHGNYEYETGYQIVDYLKSLTIDYRELEMILVGHHAPFTWGTTPAKAVYNSAVLEELAKMAFLTEQIQPGASSLKSSLIKKHFERKHGPDSYYGQST
jgi:L-ribulose-5-phosphate 4-epimerase